MLPDEPTEADVLPVIGDQGQRLPGLLVGFFPEHFFVQMNPGPLGDVRQVGGQGGAGAVGSAVRVLVFQEDVLVVILPVGHGHSRPAQGFQIQLSSSPFMGQQSTVLHGQRLKDVLSHIVFKGHSGGGSDNDPQSLIADVAVSEFSFLRSPEQGGFPDFLRFHVTPQGSLVGLRPVPAIILHVLQASRMGQQMSYPNIGNPGVFDMEPGENVDHPVFDG